MVATRSEDKLREIRQILAGVPGLEVVGLGELGIEEAPEEEHLEPHETFEENARSKADYFHAKAGIPTVAEDSGLEVDALDGAPGVRTKRFAPDAGLTGRALDDENNRYLVERLSGVAEAERTARYVCAAVLVGLGDEPVVVRGEAEGVILEAPRGKGGFGYDPFVYDVQVGRAFAEMEPDLKNSRSHRGKAFRALASGLRERAGVGGQGD